MEEETEDVQVQDTPQDDVQGDVQDVQDDTAQIDDTTQEGDDTDTDVDLGFEEIQPVESQENEGEPEQEEGTAPHYVDEFGMDIQVPSFSDFVKDPGYWYEKVGLLPDDKSGDKEDGYEEMKGDIDEFEDEQGDGDVNIDIDEETPVDDGGDTSDFGEDDTTFDELEPTDRETTDQEMEDNASFGEDDMSGDESGDITDEDNLGEEPQGGEPEDTSFEEEPEDEF